MKVLVCNERLLFRFGVDRILLMFGLDLVEKGHEVIFACGRCDERVEARFGDSVRKFPELPTMDVHGAEQAAGRAVDALVSEAEASRAFDVIVTGGWPFYTVAQSGLRHGIPTIFIDAGAVPHDGLPPKSRNIQQEIRRMRAACLPHYTRVLAISRFIRETQTVPERGTPDGVQTIYLGIDHMAAQVFRPKQDVQADERRLVEELKALASDGVPLILNLGRFEANGYKNSPALFNILDRIIAKEKRVQALILGEANEVDIPRSCRANCRLLGFLSDQALAEVMKIATLGISPSLWEGFNLPMGEMQYAGKPVLAFNIGAHPEVILNAWCLASDEREMAQKALAIISGTAPRDLSDPAGYEQYRARFTWKQTNAAYLHSIEQLLGLPHVPSSPTRRLVLVDVSNSSRDTDNSCVPRVTRRLSSALQNLRGLLLLFVWWDSAANEYRFVGADRGAFLSSYGGPSEFFSFVDLSVSQKLLPRELIGLLPLAGTVPLLFIPEIPMDGQAGERIAWGEHNGLKVAAILYDLMPIQHPECCEPEIVNMFPNYLRSLSNVDLLLPISRTTRSDFEAFIVAHELSPRATLAVISLPCQAAAVERCSRRVDDLQSSYGIVCVSIIKPGKSQLTLLRAFSDLRRRRPELDVRLSLIGNSYHGAQGLADEVRAACAKDSNIEWLGILPDEDVAARIAGARFTVYPSLVDGFGLPILESLWLGRPCLCHNKGVMAELAAEGGCMTVDMRDEAALSRALELLCDDDTLLASLESEVSQRNISTWSDYAEDVGSHLVQVTRLSPLRLKAGHRVLNDPRQNPLALPDAGSEKVKDIEYPKLAARRSLSDLSINIELETARLGSFIDQIPELANSDLASIIFAQPLPPPPAAPPWTMHAVRMWLARFKRRLVLRSQNDDTVGATLRYMAKRTRKLKARLSQL